jgi:type VI protein secretion system component VasF
MNIKLDGDEQLDQAIEALSVEMTPRNDLWPAIAADIGDRARRRDRWTDWRMIAAAATVVMAANVIVTLALIDRSDGSPVQLAFREPVSTANVQPVNYGSSVRMGPGYLQDRQALRRRLDDSLESLDPEIRATLVADVADLRAAQHQIAEALMEDADNTHLQRMLLRSLEDEVVLLSQIERLAMEQERRMDL